MNSDNSNQRILSQISLVAASNLIVIIVRGISWFVIPKVLGVTQYGYYKLFTLYLSYTLVLNLGFPDGILIYLGPKKYDEISREEIRSYSRFYILLQCALLCIGILIFVFFHSSFYSTLGILVIVDMFIQNINFFFIMLSKAFLHFKDFSYKNLYRAVMEMVALVVILVLYYNEIFTVTYELYVYILILIDIIIMIWYVKIYKEFVFGRGYPIKMLANNISNMFKTGIIITIASRFSEFIFSIDRQMVSSFFDINTYSYYSFAYSIMNIGSTVLAAVSTVILPNLQKMEKKVAKEMHSRFISVLLMIIAPFLSLIPLIEWLIHVVLPDYVTSIIFLDYVLPSILISSCLTMIIFPYYIVFGLTSIYVFFTALAFVISISLNFLGMLITHNALSLTIASICTLFIWYILVECYFTRLHHINCRSNTVFMILVLFTYYIFQLLDFDVWVWATLYFCSTIVFGIAVFKEECLYKPSVLYSVVTNSVWKRRKDT